MEIFSDMDLLLRTFWYLALPTSLIFLIQTVMTFMGTDSSDGTSADFDGDLQHADAPFQLFTLRNLINFLLGFSWTGISFYGVIPNKALLISVSLAVGILFVYLFFVIIRQIQKLGEDNSFKLANALHKTAQVYLTIPERKGGTGKILISVNGSYHELEAMTEHDQIKSGMTVKVVKIESNNILIVETL